MPDPVEAFGVQAVDGPLDQGRVGRRVGHQSEASSTSSHQATEVFTPAAWALLNASRAGVESVVARRGRAGGRAGGVGRGAASP